MRIGIFAGRSAFPDGFRFAAQFQINGGFFFRCRTVAGEMKVQLLLHTLFNADGGGFKLRSPGPGIDRIDSEIVGGDLIRKMP